MLVIGLTGGIGTGKTEVTRILRDLGAVVIDADDVAHLSYGPGTAAHSAIVGLFGQNILDHSGVIDRKSLGTIVFSDQKRRVELEAIVWPAARERIESMLAIESERGAQAVVIEVSKLFEAGWDELADVVWTVEVKSGDTGKREVVGRVQARSGRSGSGIEADTDIGARVAAQMSREERFERADVVIENIGTLGDLREQVKTVWESNRNLPEASK